MKSNSRKKIVSYSISVLVILIVFGIVYASVTHKISIMKDYSNKGFWKIKFDNLSTVTLGGTAREITTPTINTYDTRINNYVISLTSPGDNVFYSFDVVNDGNYDAIISSINIAIPKCTGSGEKALEDAENVCKHLIYTLTYEDNTPVAIGDTLFSMERKKMILTLTYDNTVTNEELIKSSVFIDNLDMAIIYNQCDDQCKVTQ